MTDIKSILENRPELAQRVAEVAEVAGYLWQKGWAERNGGNITVNVTAYADDEIRSMAPISDPVPFGMTLPHLKGCYFFCKGTNKRMRDLARRPMENGSVIRILDDCASYEIIADKAVKPTSELASHLAMHNQMIASGNGYKAALHTHPIDLVAMTHNPAFLEKDVLTNLLWSMIPETRAFCPKGLGIVPYKMPSSVELAEATIAQLREYDIAVIPFSYTVNGMAEDYNEETDFDGKAFYDAMRRGAEVKTSMVNPATAAAFFERALAQGDDVLYVGMSGGISGTAHAAALAAEELREKYPHAKIMTIDTYAASLGEGLQVLEAAELLCAGRSFEEVGDRILARRPHMCQFFTVDDLNYLKRGGRISGAAALVGSVLGIKPILRGDETGHIVSCGKVRGNKKAYAELADYFDKRALDKTARIGIAHADNREGTDYLLGLLRERGFTGECLEVYYEPVTGAHVGPGTVALFFYGTEK